MKILFLIILLLIPSISIAEPLYDCDSDDIVSQLIWMEIAIIESQRPPSCEQSEPKPESKRPHEESIDERMEKIADRLTNTGESK